MGAIEENKIEELSALTLLIDRIAQKNSELGFDIRKDFPQLFWILRDFTLDLETNSSQDYLDRCLEDVPTDKVQTEKDLAEIKSKNRLRKQVKNCFRNRTCLSFGRPVNDESILKKIDSDDQIKPEFKDDVDNLMKLLTLSITPKTANKSFLTGSVFFKFLDALISALNSGETPMLNSSVERLLASEAENKTKKIMSSCTLALDAIRERLPMPLGELTRKFNDLVFDYLEILREGISYTASKEMYSKNAKHFIKMVKEKFSELESINTTLIKQRTSSLVSTFESALPPTNLSTGIDFADFTASLKPLYNTYFGATASRDTLDWTELTQYITESLFAQFDGAASRATTSFQSQQAAAEASLQDSKDAYKRLKLAMAEVEAGFEEMKRGRDIDKERVEDMAQDVKDGEIKLLREKLARAEAKYEKEKESQSNFKKVIRRY